ncbi:Uncharacterised protein [Campylobacter hyointestinalis subsp. hyointestinalis]|uniref:Uncharacterized protein n=1 Tax=Campylobacter hyointestinalis subsp. hyointestinalis TaxID=91352 RepID=A0A9W5ASD6_CAMHY|nr:Uncharacterised protein [Campylobacter hyointestinalis subsp. hyointestinalis]
MSFVECFIMGFFIGAFIISLAMLFWPTSKEPNSKESI